MVPGANLISNKASIACVSGAGGGGIWGHFEHLSRGFRGQSSLRNFLDCKEEIFRFKEHLDWLKIDLNAAKIITVHD